MESVAKRYDPDGAVRPLRNQYFIGLHHIFSRVGHIGSYEHSSGHFFNSFKCNIARNDGVGRAACMERISWHGNDIYWINCDRRTIDQNGYAEEGLVL